MSGARRTRGHLLPAGPARAATALAACAALAAGCGVVPGTAGGSGEDPVTVMTWAPEGTDATNKPGMPALAQAYARWVNAEGGLGGRPLRVLTCNDHDDSVSAAQCAERAVEEDAVAVVGSYSQYGDTFLPTLEGAGIPYIGGYGVTGAEFTSPMSYPVNGGQPTLLAGLGRELARDCGPVSLVRPDNIAGDELPPLLDAGLRAGGHASSEDQPAREDATEYGGPSTRALEHAGGVAADPGCVVPALGDRTSTFMDSFRRARREYRPVRTATVLGGVDQTVIDATGGGPVYDGAYVTGWYPVAGDRRWKPLKKVIDAYAFGDNRIDPADAGVQTTWIAYTVFREVVESLGDGEIDSDSVRKALDGGLRVSTGGLTPPLRWPFQGMLAAVGRPRLVNGEVTFQVVRDGRLVAARKGAVDVTDILRDARPH
ncbi:ABC transporter substrate-binding protein [Streptomyces sp. NPDC056628]|uniref:ABC transporter substrate-binding protein n=1 Tax=Streptomyces sp. NPDC056628 TaxID=3345882 RepID=UPI0036B776E1